MKTGNKGEWCEVYVLLRLLADGKLHAADENLEKLEDVFYPIIAILRQEVDKGRIYALSRKIRILDSETKNELASIPISQFAKYSQILFDKLIESTGRSFEIEEVDEFLQKIEVAALKAKSIDKSDITLVVHDLNTGKKPTFGFSVKSHIGKDSTLFNSGSGTNFIFEITGSGAKKINPYKFNKETYKISEETRKSKIAIRLKKLEEVGCKLKFSHIQSENLQLNLQLIDGDLPKILAQVLLIKYRDGISKTKAILEKLNVKNPLGYNQELGHKFYGYKLKKLMSDSALGMTPKKVWTGDYSATGGIIIVKGNGEALCYHIYNRTEFHNYLIGQTRLEQASTGEDKKRPGHADPNSKKTYKFGWAYEENGKLYIKLNLQIRFDK